MRASRDSRSIHCAIVHYLLTTLLTAAGLQDFRTHGHFRRDNAFPARYLPSWPSIFACFPVVITAIASQQNEKCITVGSPSSTI